MVASVAVWAPPRLLAWSGVAIVVLSELILPEAGWAVYPTWKVVLLWPGAGDGVFVLYPALPWIGVTLLGVVFGHVLASDPQRARTLAVRFGVASLAGFLILRALNGFGNVRARQTDDVIGFLNVVKYPPAVTFLALTLGVGLLAYVWFERIDGSWLVRRLTTFGRAPVLFYLLHLYLYAQVGAWVAPTSRSTMLAWWLGGLVVIYPVCSWWSNAKHRRPDSSIDRMI
jgi:uncharacterized membrane protein